MIKVCLNPKCKKEFRTYKKNSKFCCMKCSSDVSIGSGIKKLGLEDKFGKLKMMLRIEIYDDEKE